MSSVIGSLRVVLGMDSAAFQDGLKKSTRSFQDFGKRLSMIGAAMSVVTTGIAYGIKKNLTAFDDIGKTAQKIGVPVDELSRLSHAADMSGVSMGDLENALRRVSRVMVDTPDKFAEIGVAIRDANGELRPTSDVMSEIADVLASMPDGAEKTALAFELMGRNGTALIPMLNGGAKGLQAMKDEADALGIVITPEMFANAEIFNDNISRLTKTLGGLGIMIAGQFGPILATITDKLVEWAAVFQGLSPETQRFITIGTALAAILGPLATGLGLVLMSLAPIGAALALLASPFAIATAAGIALGVAIVALVKNWDELKAAMAAFAASATQWAQDVVANIKAGLAGLYQAAVDAIAELARGFRDSITGLISEAKQWGSDIAAGITGGLAGARDKVTGAGKSLAGWVKGAFTSETEIQSPSRVFMRFGQFIAEGLGIGIRDGTSGAVDAAKGMGEGVAGAMEDFKGGFKDAISSVIDGTKTLPEAIGDMLKSIAQKMADSALDDLFNQLFGAFTGKGGDPLTAALAGAGAPVRSFAGGGYTGSGARSGGLDGRGGYMAMVHPRETVIDHTKSDGQNVRVFVDQDGNWQAAVERISGGVVSANNQRRDASFPRRVAVTNKAIQERTG